MSELRYNPVLLMSDEELITILLERFDHAIFVGRKEGISEGIEQEEEWQGDPTMCKGLALEMIEKINQDSCPIEEELE